MLQAIYFHQACAGGRVFKLVGLVHPMIMPLDRAKSTKILEVIAPADLVFCEARKILPKQRQKKSLVAECRAADRAAQEFYASRVDRREDLRDTLQTAFKEAKALLSPEKTTVRAMPPLKALGKATSGSPPLAATKKELGEFELLITSVRSVLMFSKLLQKHLRLKNRERAIALVAGVAHAIQIKRFLDKPAEFEKFVEKLLETIPKISILRPGTRKHLLKEMTLSLELHQKLELTC